MATKKSSKGTSLIKYPSRKYAELGAFIGIAFTACLIIILFYLAFGGRFWQVGVVLGILCGVTVGNLLGIAIGSAIGARKEKADNRSVALDEIPSIVDDLQKNGSDASFALFLFNNKATATGYAPGLQFSIEKGQLGLDYLLNSDFNKKEEDNFIQKVSELGCKYETREMNKVNFIRVTGDSLVWKAQEIMRRIYQVEGGEKIDLVKKGF